MPFDPIRKPFQPKKTPRSGPLDHAQETAMWAIDAAWIELTRVLTFVSRGSPEMRGIVGNIEGHVTAAKKWVRDN